MANENAVKITITADGSQAISGLNKVSGKFKQMESDTRGVFARMQDSWLKFTAAFAAASVVINFLSESVKAAYEAEVAFNKLKTQVENLGVSYGAMAPQIDAAIAKSAEYAIVQDEDVAGTLQKLIFLSGDLAGSMQNLNLVYDLAYQKGTSVEESASLIGKAMTGNVEMLGRYIPELKDVNEKLGEHATKADKAAYALALLEEKTRGASEKMTEHEKAVKRTQKAWEDFKESVGKLMLDEGDKLKKSLIGLQKMVESEGLLKGYAKWAITNDVEMEKYLDNFYKQEEAQKKVNRATLQGAAAHNKNKAEIAAESLERSKAITGSMAKYKAALEGITMAYKAALAERQRLAAESKKIEQSLFDNRQEGEDLIFGIKQQGRSEKDQYDALVARLQDQQRMAGQMSDTEQKVDMLRKVRQAWAQLTNEVKDGDRVYYSQEEAARRAIGYVDELTKAIEAEKQKELEANKEKIASLDEYMKKLKEEIAEISKGIEIKLTGQEEALKQIRELRAEAEKGINIPVTGSGSPTMAIGEKIDWIQDKFNGISGGSVDFDLSGMTAAIAAFAQLSMKQAEYSSVAANRSPWVDNDAFSAMANAMSEPMLMLRKMIEMMLPKGQFASGSPYVPRTGLYKLEQGERVVNRNDNRKMGNIIINGYNRSPKELASEIVRAQTYGRA